MNQETFEKTAVAYVETLVERDALEELLKHPLLADLPRAEGYPVLGSYVLFAQLGSGGMANVFRGVHIRLENEVAIKIRTAPVGTSAARFQREATVAAKLEHQNLVRATDVDEVSGLQYMVLDYIDGEDADERVARKGALGAREALTIIRDSALGLAEAHRLDFIHRDIKPANVMISREGRVKLADLGLAKSVVDDDLGLTATGGILGTPMYMAPEQFRRAEEVVKASDVYGLGVTLIFLLTGRHPFNGKSVPEIMQQVCVQGVAGLDQTLPEMDGRVVQLVGEIAALKSEDRPQDGAALALRMTEVLDALGGPVDLADDHAGASKARGVNPPNRAVRTRIKEGLTRVAAGPVSDSAVAPTEAPKSKLRWVAAAMLLAAAGGIGWSMLQEQEGGANGVVERILGGENESSGTAKPSELAMSPSKVESSEVIFDATSTQTEVREHAVSGEWGAGYAALLRKAEEAEQLDQLAAFAQPVERFSADFQDTYLFGSASGLLDEDGEAALLALAQVMSTQAPVTSITAAELGVEYNGLLYEVAEERRETTYRLLRMAYQGGDDDVRARSKLLEGVLQVMEYFASPKEQLGQRAQDSLTKAARADSDSEAAAWLGLLYLNFLDRGMSEPDIPVWFETENMLELLRAAVGERSSGEADWIMGHFCSDGLAGVAMSLEEAQVHYVNGAKRGHIGCVSDAVLCGADLGRQLGGEREKKILYFADSEFQGARIHSREAYALAALTSSFKDETEDRARRAKAIRYLQENTDEELAEGLTTDRKIDRLTVCLGSMMRESKAGGILSEDEVRDWMTERVDQLGKEIYSEGFPPETVPAWLLIADFDPELAKRIFVSRGGPEEQDAGALLSFFASQLHEEDYAGSPFVWSFIEPTIVALQNR